MDQERRKVIVKEIDYWQRSKLLPDHYCDFLLNLYLDQEAERPRQGWGGRAASAVSQSSGKSWFLVIASTSLICLIVLYFNVFHPLLQTALALSFVLAFLWSGLRYRSRSEPTGLGLIGAGMLLMVGLGLYMLHLHDLNAWGWSTAYLIFCSLFWVAFGAGARIPVLHFAGWAAAILVYSLLLSKNAGEPEWYEVQLYWVPVACVFGWFSWFVHRWSKQASGVLMATASLLWFMPEIYTILFLEHPVWLQTELIGKIVLGGALLFGLRKRWVAWVA